MVGNKYSLENGLRIYKLKRYFLQGKWEFDNTVYCISHETPTAVVNKLERDNPGTVYQITEIDLYDQNTICNHSKNMGELLQS